MLFSPSNGIFKHPTLPVAQVHEVHQEVVEVITVRRCAGLPEVHVCQNGCHCMVGFRLVISTQRHPAIARAFGGVKCGRRLIGVLFLLRRILCGARNINLKKNSKKCRKGIAKIRENSYNEYSTLKRIDCFT